MVPANIQDALLDELKELSPENGSRLLEVARSMKTVPLRDTRIEDILRNIEPMDAEQARELEQIIEEEFEQIEPSEW
ncbi:MAG: hypothetical protein ACHQNE_06060 [Candidatus Kapaibacterium sp.]